MPSSAGCNAGSAPAATLARKASPRDDAHREAVVGREAPRGGRGGGGQGRGGGVGAVRVGRREEEREDARAEQPGRVRGVPRGEVGARRRSGRPRRRTRARRGRLEGERVEAVRARVAAHEAAVASEVVGRRRRARGGRGGHAARLVGSFAACEKQQQQRRRVRVVGEELLQSIDVYVRSNFWSIQYPLTLAKHQCHRPARGGAACAQLHDQSHIAFAFGSESAGRRFRKRACEE